MPIFSPFSSEIFIPNTRFEQEVFDFCFEWNQGKAEFLFHTSGSTGIPKQIQISRQQLIYSAEMTGLWLDLKPNDVALLSLPVHYIAGAMVLVRALVLNLKVLLVEPVQNPLVNLPHLKIHVASFVPTQWKTILSSNSPFSDLFSEAKGILIGGSSVTKSLEQLSLQTKLPVFHTYGMTETVSHIAFRTFENDYFEVFPEVEIKVNSTDCLCIKSPVTMNKWLETHDLTLLSSKSHFKIIGRKDRIINSGGRKIIPEKIEELCIQFFSSLGIEIALFMVGLPDDFWGEKTCLLIESESIQNHEFSLIQFLKMNLEDWEIPKEFIYLKSFKKTPSGKIDRLKTVNYI